MTKNQAKAAIRQAVATAGILKVERGVHTNLKELPGELDMVTDRLFDELINANVIEVEEPLEGWVNVYERSAVFHGTESEAEVSAKPGRVRCVHVREVDE